MPQIIEIQDYPIKITISEVGIRGPSGAAGSGGGIAPISGFAGVSYLNSLSGTLFLTGLGGVTVTSNGTNIIQISGNNSAVVSLSGINNIAISQSGQVYFVSGVNLINTSQTGQFYPTSNPQFYIKSGEVLTISGILQNSINLTGQTNYNLITGFSGELKRTVDWNSTFLLDGNGIVGVWWASRQLLNSSQSITVDWQNRILQGGNWQIPGTGNFITGFNSGLYTLKSETGNYTGLFVTRNETGQFNTGNLSNYTTNINLAATGTNLQNQINVIQNQPVVTGISILGSTIHLTGYVTFAGANSDISAGQSAGGIVYSVPGLQTTGSSLYNLITGSSGQLSSNIGSTGSFLFGLINASSAGVSSLNSHSGALSLTGAGNVNVIVAGQNFTISGNTGDLVGYTTIANLQTTGQNNWISSNNNAINLSGNLQATGSYLLGLIGNSTAGVSSINSRTGTVFVTGVGTIIVTTTGQIITISGISPITGGTVAFDFGLININTGNPNSQFIQFHQNFATIPNVYGNIINNSGDPLIYGIISGTSVSGFYVNLTDSLDTNNYYFDYLATTGIGFYNFALSTINTIIGSLGGTTGSGILNYLPKFTVDGIGITNSVASSSNTGIFITGILTVTDKFLMPNANFRMKDGQMQFFDFVAYSGDSNKPWRALGVYGGATIWSDPILD